jgi:hypothetical protein
MRFPNNVIIETCEAWEFLKYSQLHSVILLCLKTKLENKRAEQVLAGDGGDRK